MTDQPNIPQKRSLKISEGHTKKRNAAEKRFRMYGAVAVLTALSLLMVLAFTIVKSGAPAFTRTVVQIDYTLTQENYDAAESQLFKTKAYTTDFANSVARQLTDNPSQESAISASIVRILGKIGSDIRAYYKENPNDIGSPVNFELSAGSRATAYITGGVTRDTFTDSRFLKIEDLDVLDGMMEKGIITSTWDKTFIFGADAGVDNPGGAGIGVSVAGSFFMMLVVLVLSLPIAVAASVYLEEFAPQNWFTDLIEVNISNLAAVPSIVFGILGLAVFIQFAEFPQSSPIVGGLVLSMMTLPTIIIATRASLKSVPPSIRDAALGVGASKSQAVFHHVLPLAAPGILTGTIIGLAQALGETAPLLLIGMVGFVAREYPETLVEGFTQANSAMPAQIYTWASRADPGFYEKAWGGIIVLLVFLLSMNIVAIILRRRFERRW